MSEAEKIDWTAESDAYAGPLWTLAARMKDSGRTWQEVADALRDGHGIDATAKQVGAAVYYQRDKHQERDPAEAPQAPQKPAPPAEDPTPVEPEPKQPAGAQGLQACFCDSVTISLPGAGAEIIIAADFGATGEEFAEVVGRVVRGVFGEVA
jgi:hypothetical protein